MCDKCFNLAVIVFVVKLHQQYKSMWSYNKSISGERSAAEPTVEIPIFFFFSIFFLFQSLLKHEMKRLNACALIFFILINQS